MHFSCSRSLGYTPILEHVQRGIYIIEDGSAKRVGLRGMAFRFLFGRWVVLDLKNSPFFGPDMPLEGGKMERGNADGIVDTVRYM